MRVLKVRTLQSDGTRVEDATFDFAVIDDDTGRPFVDDAGTPQVVFTLRPIDADRYRQMVRRHTDRVANPKTRAMEEQTDWAAVQDEAVCYAVVGWRGVLGADDKPLVCTDETKLALDGAIRMQVLTEALKTEAAEVTAASFRQPA